MFCILLIVPETAVYAEKEKDSDSYSDEADDDEIADAVNTLSAYYKNLDLINGEQLTDEQKKTLKKYVMMGAIT